MWCLVPSVQDLMKGVGVLKTSSMLGSVGLCHKHAWVVLGGVSGGWGFCVYFLLLLFSGCFF